ncbi:TPA: 4-hydroxy-tetrahydrodipicolinate synthase [Methanosarcina acetivorans]|jgi:4-hydroxy-tetrahydrodipicolinate synthase|uniref:4-hydroxy-tetrahydrodipicolinate synthase n=2 Tax=Methanosarcina acetivorans TaxID=2214 RepID=DAPA_METAC|nr:4-hydroxy-tetrahydrodipicolinate synthase [Methanosarcina acetivorans]Q8THP1.1 RecName: Full=4-hydroxy-tetrahydrodipicolinate synthase; Short=HTPA synthase [Methanosarcina acetivorans C2A]AAM07813.1 dihydrodipicolinate synthase [Methanosarcina acetivorans C2A]HIH92850.1 4-hydroxy-tetrahydrodipicolinate synthase [Methanosarcina acetivorans]
MFEGAMPALITPFTKDDRIDREGLRRNIAFVEEGGVSGIVPCGTTGESATLSALEHEEVIDIAVECAKVPVVAGTGSNNTGEALQFTKHAADAGVDGVLLISPYYNKPNPAGLLAHFKKIAEAVDIPMILYNVPSRTGQDMPVDVITKLAKVENIVGIKEASGSVGKVSQILEQTIDDDFVVLSGEDGLTLPIISVGGSGVISVAANIVPDKMSGMVSAALKGDYETARKIHFEIAPLIRALFLETNPIPAKKAAELIGLASGHLRLPLAPMSDANQLKLVTELKKLGVMK